MASTTHTTTLVTALAEALGTTPPVGVPGLETIAFEGSDRLDAPERVM